MWIIDRRVNALSVFFVLPALRVGCVLVVYWWCFDYDSCGM